LAQFDVGGGGDANETVCAAVARFTPLVLDAPSCACSPTTLDVVANDAADGTVAFVHARTDGALFALRHELWRDRRARVPRRRRPRRGCGGTETTHLE
jgi:hypothetical protein